MVLYLLENNKQTICPLVILCLKSRKYVDKERKVITAKQSHFIKYKHISRTSQIIHIYISVSYLEIRN